MKTTPARDEDLIALLAAPCGIFQAYRFYGMRHSAILPGNFIDFELESAGVFLPKMRRIMQLAMPFDISAQTAVEQLLHGGFCESTGAGGTAGGSEIPTPETAAATAGQNPLFSQKLPTPSENPVFSQKPAQIPTPSENPLFSQKLPTPSENPVFSQKLPAPSENPLFSQKLPTPGHLRNDLANSRAVLGQKATSLAEVSELLYPAQRPRASAQKLPAQAVLPPDSAPLGAAPTLLARRTAQPSAQLSAMPQTPAPPQKNIPAHMAFSRFIYHLNFRLQECDNPLYFAELLALCVDLRLQNPQRACINAAARILRAEGRLHPQNTCARCGVALGAYCALGADFLPHCRQCLRINCFATAAVQEFLATCNCAVFESAYLPELANCWQARR